MNWWRNITVVVELWGMRLCFFTGIILNTCLFTCLLRHVPMQRCGCRIFHKPHLLVRFVLQFLKRLIYLFVLHCNVIALHVILTVAERLHFLLHTFYNCNTIQGVLLLWVSKSSTEEWIWKITDFSVHPNCLLVQNLIPHSAYTLQIPPFLIGHLRLLHIYVFLYLLFFTLHYKYMK